MSRRRLVMGALMAMSLMCAPSVMAEDRPLKQFPADVMRWSTMWAVIPRQMIAVEREQGPLAAVIVGPTNGMAAMVESTGTEVWHAMQPETNPAQRYKNDEGGAVFRYDF